MRDHGGADAASTAIGHAVADARDRGDDGETPVGETAIAQVYRAEEQRSACDGKHRAAAPVFEPPLQHAAEEELFAECDHPQNAEEGPHGGAGADPRVWPHETRKAGPRSCEHQRRQRGQIPKDPCAPVAAGRPEAEAWIDAAHIKHGCESNLDPKQVEKFEITKGMFRVIDKSGKAHEVPISETDQYTYVGCGPCFDFASEMADISVGSVGSPGGWSTVLARTPAGEKLYNSAVTTHAVEEKTISDKGLTLAKKLAGDKEKRFNIKSAGVKNFGVKR